MKRFPSWSFNMSALTVRNTHGDYFISQFLCEEDRLSSIIDWTTACTHPVIWEIMRSFVYSAPCCARSEIDSQLLERYIAAYCRYGTLNDYDRENLYRLYLSIPDRRLRLLRTVLRLRRGQSGDFSQVGAACHKAPEEHGSLC